MRAAEPTRCRTASQPGAGQRHHQVHFAGIEQLRDRAGDPGVGQALQSDVDQLVRARPRSGPGDASGARSDQLQALASVTTRCIFAGIEELRDHAGDPDTGQALQAHVGARAAAIRIRAALPA